MTARFDPDEVSPSGERLVSYAWRGQSFVEIVSETGGGLLYRPAEHGPGWDVLGFVYPEHANVFYQDTFEDPPDRRRRR